MLITSKFRNTRQETNLNFPHKVLNLYLLNFVTMSDPTFVEFCLGIATAAIGIGVMYGLIEYMGKLPLANVLKSYIESNSRVIGDRRILAQDLYNRGKKDEEVQTVLDNILPIPAAPAIKEECEE